MFSFFFFFFFAALPSSRDTPSPIDPESIQVPVTYDPDPADLALSSVPGQEMFDPRKRKFSAEELKPQPMIKKARKVFIPEDLKVTGCSLCVFLCRCEIRSACLSLGCWSVLLCTQVRVRHQVRPTAAHSNMTTDDRCVKEKEQRENKQVLIIQTVM